MGIFDKLNPFNAVENIVSAGAGNTADTLGKGQGGKGGNVDVPDPLDVAVTDFLFNRVDQYGPAGSTRFYGPGEQFNAPATPGFLPGFLNAGNIQASSQNGAAITPTAPPDAAGGKGTGGANLAPVPGDQPAVQPPVQYDPRYGPELTRKMQSTTTAPSGWVSPGQTGDGSIPFQWNPGLDPGLVMGQKELNKAGYVSPGDWAHKNINKAIGKGGGDPDSAPPYDPYGNNVQFPSGTIRTFPGSPSNVSQVTQLTPEQLLLQSGALTSQANTMFDVLARQGEAPIDLTNELSSTGLPGREDLSAATGALGNLTTALPGQSDAVRRDVTRAFFDSGAALLDRNFDKDLNRIEQRLANRGFNLDRSEGASNEFGAFAQSRQDALNQLSRDAILAGGGEARADVASQLGVRGVEFSEKAQILDQLQGRRKAGLDEELVNEQLTRNAREQLFNELSVLRGGGQVGAQGVTPPGPGGLNIADAFGLEQSAQASNAANAQANKGSNIQGGAALAGSTSSYWLPALISAFSSKHLKDRAGEQTDILDRLDKVSIERWYYKESGTPHIGPMAEDFNEAFDLPDNPYIFYVDMFGVLMGAVKELKAEIQQLKEGRLHG